MTQVLPFNPYRLQIGQTALLTTDNWFTAPDGAEYKAVHGTVHAVLTAEQSLGVKTNAKSTNWYVEIGNMLVAGCQIHYAFNTHGRTVEMGPVETYSEKDGEAKIYTRPTRIYDADFKG